MDAEHALGDAGDFGLEQDRDVFPGLFQRKSRYIEVLEPAEAADYGREAAEELFIFIYDRKLLYELVLPGPQGICPFLKRREVDHVPVYLVYGDPHRPAG